jgi:hypothetical protein
LVLSKIFAFQNVIFSLILLSLIYLIVYGAILVFSGLPQEDRMILVKLRGKVLSAVLK